MENNIYALQYALDTFYFLMGGAFVMWMAAASGGLLGALVISYLKFRKADLTMILNGALAGLVAITASPDTTSPALAVLIGVAAGILVVFSILLMDKLQLDDPVGASFAVWWLLKRFFGLRISAEDEYQGADISECGMETYPEFSNKS